MVIIKDSKSEENPNKKHFDSFCLYLNASTFTFNNIWLSIDNAM